MASRQELMDKLHANEPQRCVGYNTLGARTNYNNNIYDLLILLIIIYAKDFIGLYCTNIVLLVLLSWIIQWIFIEKKSRML